MIKKSKVKDICVAGIILAVVAAIAYFLFIPDEDYVICKCDIDEDDDEDFVDDDETL